MRGSPTLIKFCFENAHSPTLLSLCNVFEKLKHLNGKILVNKFQNSKKDKKNDERCKSRRRKIGVKRAKEKEC